MAEARFSPGGQKGAERRLYSSKCQVGQQTMNLMDTVKTLMGVTLMGVERDEP